jgi:glutaredoxin 3
MIKIYGKDNCAYCNMAKQLCESKGLEYEYLSLGEDFFGDEFFDMFPTARTFPQITMEGEAIGGFTELKDKV